MTRTPSRSQLDAESAKRRRVWDKRASSYDKSIDFFERRVFGTEHRAWACAQAEGDTLEVAVGTGLNLELYPERVRLTGIDISDEMLSIARERATEGGVEVELRQGDAHALPFPDSSFDSVVATYSLCNIPDTSVAVAEMKRVLRPGGKLILVDHIHAATKPVFLLQKTIEFFTKRLEGEHMTRRPLEQVIAYGFEVVVRERFGLSAMVERVVAKKA